MQEPVYIDLGQVEVFNLQSDLASFGDNNLKRKFAKANQKELMERLIDELSDGSLYLGDWSKGEIQITGVRRIVSNRYWTEIEYDVLFPPKAGKSEPAVGTYRNIVWNAGAVPGSGVLAITTKGEIVLLRSFRHAVRSWTLELPRGVRKPGESPADCAKREGLEECGVVMTATSKLVDLGLYQADTGVLRMDVPLFCLTDVEVDESRVSRDISESTLKPILVGLERFGQMVKIGEIRDGFVQAAVLRAMLHGLLPLASNSVN